ncbi:exopolyphosphatase / guanosine-5'-triphosphate,3'-diphosphate pyrophosphatase [Parapedobacter composti]|uniref:Exopolyphosphatase / guanosine-5'-triphosphate,3'-diphosphate pyrophosphatase n=1 Tax=Parapedobacter composti TaxID=623281 RepID=A0A1I1M9T2_9SPHI|nr:exopolyphosphatase [Parapedobacter composti]SFC81562.1 exopolyphosphatase / guanosine-5'-triphosphate,3'-diphosphate pyrophosphatase [Parapedobacter composti]
MRYAAIDIGSNAVRLLIADIIQNNDIVSFKKNTLVRVPLRLGDDAFIDRKISTSKATDLVKTMTAFRNLMDVYKVSEYMACATSAMREAENGTELLKEIKATGIDLEIIAGQEEAKIIYSSHIEQHLGNKKVYLYIDVGGGSTELSVFADTQLVASASFNIGTIRILDNQDKEETWEEMKAWVKTHTQPYKTIYGIGTGGNINKLSRLASNKEDKPISYAKLKSLYEYLNSFSLKDRINVLGLNNDRADVIIPACEIFLTLMKYGRLRQIIVPRVGLVDGIIQTLIDKHLSAVVAEKNLE